MNVYQQHNYHLTITANALENMKPDKKTNYTTMWEKTLSDDILLLHECAFIKHKNRITEYQKELKKREDEEFEELQVSYYIIIHAKKMLYTEKKIISFSYLFTRKEMNF